MKSCSKKSIMVLAAALAIIPSFARGKEDRQAPAKEARPRIERCRCRMAAPKFCTMGTVTEMDEGSGILKVRDADGKEQKVSVNPMTLIIEAGEWRGPETKAAREEKMERPPMPEKKSISDIKVGKWVAVEKFNTKTETINARRIIIK